MTPDLASTGGPRIPEGPEDMPGGPDGGTPIRPPDRKKPKKTKKKKDGDEARDEEE